MPRVSIGLPVYNGERFLAEALDSILAQTFADFELIISDNASTDGTQGICRVYEGKDHRIRYFRNERNLGAAENFNRVFKLSTGEYFKWCAYDDVCAPTFLEKCIEVLDQDPFVVLCYPKTTIIDENGSTTCNYEDRLNLQSSRPHERFRQLLTLSGECNAIFGLFRASTLSKTLLIGRFQTADLILLLEASLLGKFQEVSERLFFRRDHPQMSVRANLTRHDFAIWYDTAFDGRSIYPRIRLFSELLKLINRFALNWHAKLACYIQVGRWSFRQFRNKGGECKELLREMMHRSTTVSRILSILIRKKS